jgi:ribosomal protein S18 acetylase RimI-like enzyme
MALMTETSRRQTLAGYRGHVDAIEPVLSGWVTDSIHPLDPVVFFVGIDEQRRFQVVADRLREDVAAAGLAAPRCGFAFELPSRFRDGGEHEIALLLPDGRNLNLPGSPPRVALGELRAELVPAGAADRDAVLDLLRRTDFEAGFDPDRVGPDNAAAFDSIRSSDRGLVLYARVGAKLVGYGRFDRGIGNAALFGVVALTVLEAYRRKGLGERLLRALQAAGASTGLQQLWLSVRPDNTPALQLYRKLHFIEKPDRPPGPWAVTGEITMVWMPPVDKTGRS